MNCIHSKTNWPRLRLVRAVFGAIALLLCISSASALPSPAVPQDGEQTKILGTLVSVDAEIKTLTIRTDQGAEQVTVFNSATRCLLVPPGETDLGKAEAVECAAINPGDRILARGQVIAEGQPPTSAMVIVMLRTALDDKREADLETWRTRGISGQVTETDAVRQEIVIQSKTLREAKDIILDVDEGTRVRRYPPGKFRYADAVASSLTEIRSGDQLQVLGEPSEDSNRIRAEEIIAGSFRTFAATIVSINAEADELEVKNLENGRTVTVQVGESPMLRRLPERMAIMLARLIGGEQGPGPRGRGGVGGARRGGDRRPAGDRGRGQGGGDRQGRPPSGFRQILSRAPEFSLAELKPGEALIISATYGSDDAPRVAITILAGVEPMLETAQRGSVGGNWNFEINEVQ